jgi:CHAT domain-containing protein
VSPELAREQHVNQAEYERTLSELEGLDPTQDAGRCEQLRVRLRELREDGAAIREKVRAASPRLDSLQAAPPVDLAVARASLESDGLFLAYAVGREKTLLFVVAPAAAAATPGLSVYTIPLGEQALKERVASFRNLINHPQPDRRALRAAGAELYDQLLRPASGALHASRRLTLSPDGPLHLLPFSALVPFEPAKDGAAWLAEWRPLHIVASASHYAELQRSRDAKAPRELRLAAFGDPVYPSTAPTSEASPNADAAVRLATTRTAELGPLPSTRREVESIASLFGTRAVTYLGAAASEERVKAGLRDFAYVHFACHGLIDEQQPLHSALVLSLPAAPAAGSENGVLQVWEIFDSVRLDADLVTLSACNTAVGQDVRGEGLQGLARAFQYAGARSVLASLWSVSDDATADLMERFYRALTQGQSKVEALQQAQNVLITRGAPPLYWATFEIFGDWR